MIDDEQDDEHDDEHEGPWRDGNLWVLNRKCTTCIFRPGNLMKLHPGRVQQMVDDCLAQDTVIPCHATLDGPKSICRGFYDRHRRDTLTMRLGALMDVFAFDPPPEGH